MPEITLAVFDLDGTITRHDTLWPYIRGYLCRHPGRWWRLLPCLLPLLRYVCGRRDRGLLKGAVIHLTLGGVQRAALAAWSREFTSRPLGQRLRRRGAGLHRGASPRAPIWYCFRPALNLRARDCPGAGL